MTPQLLREKTMELMKYFFCASLLLFSASCLGDGEPYFYRGTVTDATDGTPINGATVYVINGDARIDTFGNSVTDSAGRYDVNIWESNPGDRVSVNADGFVPQVAACENQSVGEYCTSDFSLTPISQLLGK